MDRKPVVIVTGGFGALGRAVATLLASRQYQVALVDNMPQAPAEPLNAAFALKDVDLTDGAAAQESIEQIARALGSVDALVNLAGGFRWESVEGGSLDTWDSMYSVNLKTAVSACKAALPALLASEHGCIVNVGAASATKGSIGMGAYAAAKSGLLRLTEALADECKARGLRVNAVLPGIIDTAANRRSMPEADVSQWVSPEDVAEVIAFLLSDAARAVTGAAIPVTGRL